MIVFVLSNCKVKVRESNAVNFSRTKYMRLKGMDYYIFESTGAYSRGIITVVNLTKDSLEVEYYKKMLEQ
jgi:hypothetical protein